MDEDNTHFRLSLKAVAKKKPRSFGKSRIIQELPEMKIGFSSLAEKLPEWINEAVS